MDHRRAAHPAAHPLSRFVLSETHRVKTLTILEAFSSSLVQTPCFMEQLSKAQRLHFLPKGPHKSLEPHWVFALSPSPWKPQQCSSHNATHSASFRAQSRRSGQICCMLASRSITHRYPREKTPGVTENKCAPRVIGACFCVSGHQSEYLCYGCKARPALLPGHCTR